MNNNTKALAKFSELKQKHPDAVLLFREDDMDLYTAFQEDADTVSKTLSLPSCEAGGVKTTSFPRQDLDTALPRLIRAGHRIAICEY